jgi:hypothetical protein
MRRVIATREAVEVGKCIYCGTTEGRLTTEHITALGLSGRLELLHASCDNCAKITGAIEEIVLRSMRAARAELGTKTRHAKNRKEPQPMLVEKDGRSFTIYAPLSEHWKVIRLPIFPMAAAIDGRAYESGIESDSMDEFQLVKRHEEVAARHGVDRIIFPEYPSETFARVIAKMAYGYAVERCTLNAFEEVYVAPAILGKTNDIGRWVGCPSQREFPKRDCNISVGFKIIPERDLVVRIKMFPRFDGAEYVVLVGKLKPVYAASLDDRILSL